MFTKFKEVSLEYLPKVLGTLRVSLHLTANIWKFLIAKAKTRKKYCEDYFNFNSTSNQLITGMAKIIFIMINEWFKGIFVCKVSCYEFIKAFKVVRHFISLNDLEYKDADMLRS